MTFGDFKTRGGVFFLNMAIQNTNGWGVRANSQAWAQQCLGYPLEVKDMAWKQYTLGPGRSLGDGIPFSIKDRTLRAAPQPGISGMKSARVTPLAQSPGVSNAHPLEGPHFFAPWRVLDKGGGRNDRQKKSAAAPHGIFFR